MSFRIRTESFEGPFDLLLYLVSRQRIDIGSISITQIADQYLNEISHMQMLDLDVASDFLVVASTLLEIKAASLIPQAKGEIEEEFEELTPNEARDILLERLLTYKKYKNAATALDTRFHAIGRMHARHFGPPPEFMNLFPDYLENVTLDDLAQLCIGCATRRDSFLLESEHIAAKPIPVENYVRSLHERIAHEHHVRFSELVTDAAPLPIVVVTFLAVLELFKRNMVTVVQDETFGDMEIDFIEGSGELFESDEDLITSVGEGQ